MKLPSRTLWPVLALLLILGVQAPSTAQDSPRTINVTIENFSFTPSTIQVEPGETVIFNVTNKDSASHTFTVDGVFDLVLAGGENGTVTYTAPTEAQTVGFRCRFHASMTGTIEVKSEETIPPVTITLSNSTTSSSTTNSSTTEDTTPDTSSASRTPVPVLVLLTALSAAVTARQRKRL